jgi:hypothetical protein
MFGGDCVKFEELEKRSLLKLYHSKKDEAGKGQVNEGID